MRLFILPGGKVERQESGAKIGAIHERLAAAPRNTAMMTLRRLLPCLSLLPISLAPLAAAPAKVSRGEAVEIARSFADYAWYGGKANVRAGKDSAGVDVRTPSAASRESAEAGYWSVGQENRGVPYKWGGFDSLTSFAAGVRAGKAAGDLYSADKRRLGDAAVSTEAVGVDCSGFVSRCWKLPKKYGTANLPALCTPLSSTDELKPGDIMNAVGGHVMLFARWLDGPRDRALFYEANPFSKVQAGEFSVRQLAASGFRPWRLRGIRE